VKEDARDVRGSRPWEEVVQDVRYALRGLRRSPGFTLSIILTIGLGLGISTSAFTIFNAYVLRPFDVRDPYSLYAVQWQDRAGRIHDLSSTSIDALRGSHSAFSDIAIYRTFSARLKGLSATGDGVSENYFNMLGIRPAIGRTLISDDRATPVIVLSYLAWRTRFGGDSAIVGRIALVHGAPFRVVGVAREGFEGLFKKPRDFWIPIGSLDRFDSATVKAGGSNEHSTIARLTPGVSEGQGRGFVASQLQSLTAGLADTARFARAFLTSRATAIPRSVSSYLAFAPLVIAFGLVLVLACANVANMLLARGLARQRELGVRLALGAARARLVRQLVTESIVLALPAVALGFGIAWLAVDVGVRTLFMTLPSDLAAFVRLVPLEPDMRVAGFSVVAAVGAAFVFGLAPSLHTTRVSVVQATRGIFLNAASPNRLRNLLVIGQIVVASMLLITAGVLLREASRLGRTDTGLRTHDVLSVEIQQRSRTTVLAALRANRLVDTIAAAAALPLDMKFPTISVVPSGDSSVVQAMHNEVSGSYFDVLAIGLTSGRGFTSNDESGGAATVIISDAAARRFWPGGSPLGRTLRLQLRNDSSESMTRYQNAKVIGTVRDVVVNSVEMGKERPVLYFPTSTTSAGCCILVRAKGDPSLAKRTIDVDLDREAPGAVDRIDRLETFVAGAVYPYRVAYWIALGLGLTALGLTAVGVYGVVAFVVGQRTREISIRIALGASTRDVLTLVLRESVRHALIGLGIGAVLAVGAEQIVRANVQNMPVVDVVAFIAASTCVFAACMCAALLPSRRAAKTDPSASLRYD
jgi:predicted permease